MKLSPKKGYALLKDIHIASRNYDNDNISLSPKPVSLTTTLYSLINLEVPL